LADVVGQFAKAHLAFARGLFCFNLFRSIEHLEYPHGAASKDLPVLALQSSHLWSLALIGGAYQDGACSGTAPRWSPAAPQDVMRGSQGATSFLGAYLIGVRLGRLSTLA
jgi:hypothetical protein